MRKIRIDKNTSITGDVIKWVISKHKAEKDRINKQSKEMIKVREKTKERTSRESREEK